jgi:hypothetical protein
VDGVEIIGAIEVSDLRLGLEILDRDMIVNSEATNGN